ncbi:MAG: NTP-transf-2 domain-containing protein [Lachnoclostridium sp.]
MRTYDAIEKVSNAIIKDGLCEAILIKGSIGRGDDDEYSDVDMYVVVRNDQYENFLNKRIGYLTKYRPVLYSEHVNFVADQIVAIYDDGLHFDLYTVTEETMPYTDKAKIIYDPNKKFADYHAESRIITNEELAECFSESLYDFIEGDTAYCRKNYPWAAYIMFHAIAKSTILLRYLYDKEHAYLGLKKINEIIPKEQFSWIMSASSNLNKDDFSAAIDSIITILEYVVNNIDEDIRRLFNIKFFEWIKENLKTKLFVN